MPRWQIALAALAIFGGIVLQMPFGMEATPPAEIPVGAEEVPRLEIPPTPEGLETVALEVIGMTCAGCPATARLAMGKVDGVQDADFLYETGEGFVTYDPDVTYPTEILAELTRWTGFRGEVTGRN